MTVEPLCETIIINDGFVFKEFYLLLKTDSFSVIFCKKKKTISNETIFYEKAFN